jgi:hypothetical protein
MNVKGSNPMHPFQIAAACRLHQDLKAAVRFGFMDPDQLAPAQRAAAVQACLATPICLSVITELSAESEAANAAAVSATLKGWGPTRHHQHHGGVRTAVHTTLLVVERLRRDATAAAERNPGNPGNPKPITNTPALREGSAANINKETGAEEADLAPLILPPEMWLTIMGFYLRQHWDAHTHMRACTMP